MSLLGGGLLFRMVNLSTVLVARESAGKDIVCGKCLFPFGARQLWAMSASHPLQPHPVGRLEVPSSCFP